MSIRYTFSSNYVKKINVGFSSQALSIITLRFYTISIFGYLHLLRKYTLRDIVTVAIFRHDLFHCGGFCGQRGTMGEEMRFSKSLGMAQLQGLVVRSW